MHYCLGILLPRNFSFFQSSKFPFQGSFAILSDVCFVHCCVSVSLNIISCCHFHVNMFFIFFSTERRRRDLNPRAAINDLLPFQGSPFNLLGTSQKEKKKRRGWDSNPCALSDKRFSRPPRYDHFDTSPYSLLQNNLFCSLCLLLPQRQFVFYHFCILLSIKFIKFFSDFLSF